MAMEEQKRTLRLSRVLLVKFAYQLGAVIDQRIFLIRGFGRIRQIGEQREINIGIMVAQKPDFQIVRQSAHLLPIEQQAGDSHQRRAVGRNSFREIQLGENLRFQQRSDQIVHQLDRPL